MLLSGHTLTVITASLLGQSRSVVTPHDRAPRPVGSDFGWRAVAVNDRGSPEGGPLGAAAASLSATWSEMRSVFLERKKKKKKPVVTQQFCSSFKQYTGGCNQQKLERRSNRPTTKCSCIKGQHISHQNFHQDIMIRRAFFFFI